MDIGDIKFLEQPAELDEASRLLLKAAHLIEARGHAKNTLEDEKGRLCISGALGVAYNGDSWSLPAGAWDRICKALGMRDACIWNNKPERTKEEVVAKLRAVALGG